jgi:FMN phosphatase YigB (HAD superfamily)
MLRSTKGHSGMSRARFTVLLDYDGTLVEQNLKRAYRLLLTKYNIPRSHVLAERLYARDRELCRIGEYDRRKVFQSVRLPRRIGRPESLTRKLWLRVLDTQELKEGAEYALARLKEAGAKLCCVTETDGHGSNKRKRVEGLLGKWFGKSVFIAGRRGVPPKTSLRFWKNVLRRVSTNSEDCFVVGDKPQRDLLPPMSLGARGLQLWNHEYPFRFFPFILSLDKLSSTIAAIRRGKKLKSNTITFISHAWKDRRLAKQVCDFIRKDAGAGAWIAEYDLKAGQYLKEELREAVFRCPIFLVILTKHSMHSEWILKEIRWALAAKKDNLVTILPVLAGKIAKAEIPKGLSELVYVDFRRTPFAERRQKLLREYRLIKHTIESRCNR